MHVTLSTRWTLTVAGDPVPVDPLLFSLLAGVRDGGHLNHAAKRAAVSYRHAWGLVRDWETRLGEPLLNSRQGRGAKLTPFGEAVLDTFTEAMAELAPVLDAAALKAADRLSEARSHAAGRVIIASSHGDRVLDLKNTLAERFKVTLDVAGSETALGRFRRGEADVAGFHLPLGPLGASVGASLLRLLDGAGGRVFLLEHRVIGLVSRPDRPVESLEALGTGAVRFVNRQEGAGTRMMFDRLCGDAGIDVGAITGYGDEEYSHSAVAALVASGSADAGFASEAAAQRLDLRFVPFVEERFYLVVRGEADARVLRGVAEFAEGLRFPARARVDVGERTPDVAMLKRIHGASSPDRTLKRKHLE